MPITYFYFLFSKLILIYIYIFVKDKYFQRYICERYTWTTFGE